MDTIFMMPDATWSTKINIFFDHTLTMDKITPWINELLNSVNDKRGQVPTKYGPCLYDRQNLKFSRIFLLVSVTPKFRREIQNSVGLSATGIEVFICMLHRELHLVVSFQRELIAMLEKLDITQEAGENAPAFNTKVQEICEAIEQSGPIPQDLNLLVMRSFLKSQVPLFSNAIGTKYLELQMDPFKYNGRQILTHNEELYLQLKP